MTAIVYIISMVSLIWAFLLSGFTLSDIETYENFDEFLTVVYLSLLPVIASYKMKSNQTIAIVISSITGYSLGTMRWDLFVNESNLWPFSFFIALIFSVPIVLLYITIVYVLEGIPSKRVALENSNNSLKEQKYTNSFLNYCKNSFLLWIPVGVIIGVYVTDFLSWLTYGIIFSEVFAVISWIVNSMYTSASS